MTMEEIDSRRAELGERRTISKDLAGRQLAGSPAHDDALYKEACAERNVEEALFAWWAQQCRDAPPCPRCGTNAMAFLVGGLAFCACGCSAYTDDGVNGITIRAALGLPNPQPEREAQ